MYVRRWLRRARREPGATTATIGVLALGIAANVVVFQCVERLVLAPLPLVEADRIVVVGSELPGLDRPLRYFEALSGPEIAEVEAGTRVLEALLAFDLNSVRLQGTDFPARQFAAFTWHDPAPLLGAQPMVGRSFTADELSNGAPVALLSHFAWVRDFAGDSSAVGGTFHLDGTLRTIIGVLPPFATVYGVDVWLPTDGSLEAMPADQRQFNLLARTRDGSDEETVASDLERIALTIGSNWAATTDDYYGWSLRADGFARQSAAAFADEAVLTMIGALLILALVCINLGSLALVRGVRRRGETATELALGAGWGGLARNAGGEAVALATAGGLLGTGLAAATLGLLNQRLPGIIQPLGPVLSVDGAGVRFGALVTAGAALLLSLAAVLSRAGTQPSDILAGDRGALGGRRVRAVQSALVTMQISLGLALAVGAGTMGTTVARLLSTDPGFDVDGIVSMRLSLPPAEYVGESVPLFYETLQEALVGLPGVAAASMATQVAPGTVFSAEVESDATIPGENRRRILHTVIGVDYWEAMGIPIVAGRPLDRRDRAGGVPTSVLNERAATELFPDGEALGRRVRVFGSRFESGWTEVVGISADVRHRGVDAPAAPEVFTSHHQAGGRYGQMFLIARSRGEPEDLVAGIRAEVQKLDSNQPVYSITTARAALENQVGTRRLAAGLLVALAGFAVGLAGMGLHSVLSYAVATRRAEFAIRSSLGAAPAALRRLLMVDVVRTTAAGLLVGLLLTLWLGWLLRAVLGPAPDGAGMIVSGAAVTLTLVALLAAAVPAARVGRTHPADALRK